MAEKTHKHGNVIDDILDLGLALIASLYVIFGEQIGVQLDDQQLAQIAIVGGAARASLRRILRKLWGDGLESTPQPSPSKLEVPESPPADSIFEPPKSPSGTDEGDG